MPNVGYESRSPGFVGSALITNKGGSAIALDQRTPFKKSYRCFFQTGALSCDYGWCTLRDRQGRE